MAYRVVPYSAINREAYASLLEGCPGATPFHSLEWMRIYELFSRKACQFLVCAQEGNRLLAAMPVTVFQQFGIQAVFSSGFGGHGGPIARPGCDTQVLAELLKKFATHFRGPRIVLSSVQDFLGFGAPLQDWGFKATRISTHVMPLPNSYEELEKRAKSTVRWHVHRAAKAGICVSESRDTDDFERWAHLCSANYIAHGRRPYPAALYPAVAERIRETDTFRFYAAKLDGRVVGGSVLVCALGQVYSWMTATDPEFRAYSVNDAVLQTIFQDVIEEGLTGFDFGLSPTGAKGLTSFKEKWGGVQKDYWQYSYSSSIGGIGANFVRYGKLSWRPS
ncbi:GNAT family N-acetyltransferase [Candidatus Methylomirabilis sp.]|uniref:GNAT family N-acetyltransferase n=1 Tax=Candidatus Methylomirabilis sp. TaxID=2032687 RepID=UPI003076453E